MEVVEVDEVDVDRVVERSLVKRMAEREDAVVPRGDAQAELVGGDEQSVRERLPAREVAPGPLPRLVADGAFRVQDVAGVLAAAGIIDLLLLGRREVGVVEVGGGLADGRGRE